MSIESTSANAPTTFHFHTSSIRVVDCDSEIWFVANDVCSALGLHATATRRLDDDEKGLRLMQTPSGAQEIGIVNESGMYSLVLRSRKAEAKAFKRWITHEVLPAIRKTGQYSPPDRPTTAGQFTQADLLTEVLTYGRFFMTVVKGQIRLDPVADDAVLLTDPEDFAKYVTDPVQVPLHVLPKIIENAAHRLNGKYGRKS